MAEHEHEGEAVFGMALGFRTLEDSGELFLAEAEIAPYVDEPGELGVTLVFHPLDGIDPTATNEEETEAYPVDIDDDLTREASDSMAAQFRSIVRQLHGLSDAQLRRYLGQAKDAAGI